MTKRIGRDPNLMTVPQAARESGLPEYLLRACLKDGHPAHLDHISVERLDGKHSVFVKRDTFNEWMKARQK